jgi:hypothetical protein
MNAAIRILNMKMRRRAWFDDVQVLANPKVTSQTRRRNRAAALLRQRLP